MTTDPRADRYFAQGSPWAEGLLELRRLVLATGLHETVKWGAPCYTHHGRNVVMIIATKGYFGLWFSKGSLLKDPGEILHRADPKTQGLRQMRFNDVGSVRKSERLIAAYVHEAILLEELGAKVVMKPVTAKDLPTEWAHFVKTTPGLQKAFDALTPGRKREYLAYFSSAKRAATRQARIAKCMERIMAGKGPDEPL